MPINTLHQSGILERHEAEIRAIKKQLKHLASPAISSLAIYPTSDIANLDLNDGNTFISKDSTPSIIFVVGNVTYSVPGSAI